MRVIICGHRGVGKSSLLKRWQEYLQKQDEKMQGTDFSKVVFLDLDQEIEKEQSQKISDIFIQKGEPYFRELEKTTFKKLIAAHAHFMLSVGGGFDLNLIPKDIEVFWLQRETDLIPRIFADRPRLDSNLAPQKEYQERFDKREPKMIFSSQRQYLMPEGFNNLFMFEDVSNLTSSVRSLEKDVLFQNLKNVGGFITVMPQHIKSQKNRDIFLKNYLNAGVEYFEIRNDYLLEEDYKEISKLLPAEKILFSVRRQVEMRPDFKNIDWALELGEPRFRPEIVSLHEKRISLEATLDKLEKYESYSHLKLAIPIYTFEELKTCYLWQQKKPQNRSFLPSSDSGRWTWFRQFMKGKQFINFWREGRVGSSIDQPSLFQWLMTPQKFEQFAAVLGFPIKHSWSPTAHYDYFNKLHTPFFQIPIEEKDFDEALEFLKFIGLKFAAVTSPLKEKAGSQELKAANTLFVASEQVYRANTDHVGLAALVSEAQKNIPQFSHFKIAVWGGGGTLPSIKEVLPQAQFYSMREGKPREGSSFVLPDVVIWAGGHDESKYLLPADWKPQFILDLNYKESSFARYWAQKLEASYIDGSHMFYVQALEQQKFWTQCLEKNGK